MKEENNSTLTMCANCGKGEECSGDLLKSCTACKMVKYCNRECQIAHRPQHKKSCKKRAAELYDEKLFGEPPPREECPICFLPLPLENSFTIFESCCGKDICNGCVYAMFETGGKNMKLCPFCKTPQPTSHEEELKRFEKLMEKGNVDAINQLASYYTDGVMGLPQDNEKSNELLIKAVKLGHGGAYYNLGNAYFFGRGMAIDKLKAKYYWELATMNGCVEARHNLGLSEKYAGNQQRAYKHLILAAKAGYKESLDEVKEGYIKELVTKDEYAQALRAYQKLQDETKSDMRDKARANNMID